MTDENKIVDEIKEEDASSAQKPAEDKTEKKKDEKSSSDKSKKKTEKVSTGAKYIRTAKGKKRVVKQVSRGRAYIHASLNNTIITVTDVNGNTLAWASAGNCGFRGPKKATPYAAGKIVDKVAEKLESIGLKELSVVVTGIGNGRDSAVRSLNAKGFNITSIKERTPVPHNGCRPRRSRRV